MGGERRARGELLGALGAALRKFSDEDVLYSQAVADRLGVNLTDFKCVSLLEREGPMTAGRLAEETGLTSGAVTGVTDRLEKAGFVRRSKDAADRRVVIVEAVAERAPEFDRLLAPLNRAMADLCAKYGEEELGSIVDFVARTSDLLHAQAAKLRAGGPEHEAAAAAARAAASHPLSRLDSARLRLANGTHSVLLRADPRLATLYKAHFEGREPEVLVEDGDVTIRYPRFSLFDWRKVSATLTLNAHLPWAIELRGGVSRLTAELGSLKLGSLELKGGVSDVVAALPRPLGTVPIRIGGGVSNVTLTRPAGAAARVDVSGGASKLVFDDQKLGAIGGHTTLATPGWSEAEDRYEITVTGGASKLTIGTR